jgi:hypothetical protein
VRKRSRKPPPAAEPDTGGWFLDMLGIEGAAPADAPRKAPRPEPRPEPPEEIAPRLGDVGVPGDSTSELVEKLWEATDQDVTIDWSPLELSTRLRSKRTFRWTVIGFALIVAAGIYATIRFLPEIAESRASQRAAEYVAALDEVAASIPEMRSALPVLADPAAGSESVLLQLGTIARFAGRSEDAAALAAESLPGVAPLVPTDAIEDLAPARERLAHVGMQGASFAARLNDVLSYRIILTGAFELPSLPVQIASSDDIAPLGVALAQVLVDTIAVAGDLPDEPLFTEHHAQLIALATDFEARQADYLDALRRDDFERATEFVVWIEGELDVLDTALDAPLVAIGDWGLDQLDDLERKASEARVLAGT